jgi:GLPGLI family protein
MKHLFLLLFTTFLFSQTTKATYQLETNFSKEQLNDEYIGNYMNAIKDVAHYVEYNLVFNDSIANFYLIEKNVADENYINAVNFTGGNSKRFYDKNFCYNFSSESFVTKKNEYLIKSEINDKWNITTDTLTVNGYKCYKAISEVVVEHKGKTFKHDKIAWFCPEIPSKFGPKDSGNLPGLILFLEESGIIFKLKSIKFNDNTKIEQPILKNIISIEDFEKKIDEKFKDGIRD